MTPQYYIVNALGFALQLAPVMCVVLRPFGAGRYRMPRRKLMTALVVFGMLASAAFSLATCFIDVVDPAIVGNFYLFAAAVYIGRVRMKAKGWRPNYEGITAGKMRGANS